MPFAVPPWHYPSMDADKSANHTGSSLGGRPDATLPPVDPAFAGANLEFPLGFDLKIIYVLASGTGIVEDLQAIYERLGVKCAMIQGVAKPGATYGKMGSRLTFESREQLYATYEAIGKLPYVKAAL